MTRVLIKITVTETEVWTCDLEWTRWRQEPRERLCKHGCIKMDCCISFITRNRPLRNAWRWENFNTARCHQNWRSDTMAFLSECFPFITRKLSCVIESGRVGGGGGGTGERGVGGARQSHVLLSETSRGAKPSRT